MYLLGTMFILFGVAAALVAAASYALVTRGNTGALIYGRIGTRAALVAVLLIGGLLVYLFANQRYDVKYVYDYSDASLEMRYRLASIWAGQPGSFVIWALWGLVAAQILIRRARHAEPYVLSVFMLIQGALLSYMLIRNPFVPYLDANGAALAPLDGKGLNPTLHNPWMVIHPPILFVGYALMAVPFAYAIGGLWRREYDSWVERALPWAVTAWCFLGTALLLGGYWAYETLGWGGYWGWDPVENSALVPWLICTALIHALLVQRTHGALRRSAFALAIGAYLFVFYATFLTRTGVLSSFSVHSFVEEDLKNVMIGSLVALIIASIAFLAWRWRDIPSRPLSDKLLSRDSFFVLGIISLLVIAVIVSFGTSMPVVSSIPGIGQPLQDAFSKTFEVDRGNTVDPNAPAFTDGRFGLVSSFYSTTVPPIALIILALLIVAPLLGWRDTNMRNLLRALRWPGVLAVAVTCGSVLLGVRSALPLAYMGLSAFALGTNVLMIVRTLRSGFLRIGGYLAHVGLAIMLAGIIGSSYYGKDEQRLTITEGQSIGMFGYNFAFNGWQATVDGKGMLDLTVTRGNESFHATPQLYFNQKMGAEMATPSIKTELFRDLYISPVEYWPPTDRNIADLGINDTQIIGKYKVTFLGFDAAGMTSGNTPEIGAKLLVSYDDQAADITPKISISATETDPQKALQPIPVALPDGRVIRLEGANPTTRHALIRIQGLNLPVDPAKTVVAVSLKPAIQLVWFGVLIGVLGGVIAVVRRSAEGDARLAGRRVRLPGKFWGKASAPTLPIQGQTTE